MIRKSIVFCLLFGFLSTVRAESFDFHAEFGSLLYRYTSRVTNSTLENQGTWPGMRLKVEMSKPLFARLELGAGFGELEEKTTDSAANTIMWYGDLLFGSPSIEIFSSKLLLNLYLGLGTRLVILDYHRLFGQSYRLEEQLADLQLVWGGQLTLQFERIAFGLDISVRPTIWGKDDLPPLIGDTRLNPAPNIRLDAFTSLYFAPHIALVLGFRYEYVFYDFYNNVRDIKGQILGGYFAIRLDV